MLEQVSQRGQSRQIPVGKVWECEGTLGFVLAQVPWAGGAVELQNKLLKTAQKQFRNSSETNFLLFAAGR